MSVADIRSKISAAKDIKEQPYRSDAWGVDLLIIGMSGGARGRLMKGAYDENGTVDYVVFYPMLLIETAHDPETRERIFSEGDVEFLNSKSADSLEGPAMVAMTLSGLSKADLKGAEKNSAVASVSSIESPKPSEE